MAATAASPVPQAPWRLWRSRYLWLATIHVLGDSVVVLTLGLVTLLLVAVVALTWPLGYLRIPLARGANLRVYKLAAYERGRAMITREQDVPPLVPPLPSGSPRQDALEALADPGLWRQLCYYFVLVWLATAWLVLIAISWSVPPTLIALPAYYTHFAAGQAQLGPFTIDSFTKASVVAVIAFLFLALASPWLMRSASAVDAWLARAFLGPSETGVLAERVNQLVRSRQQVVDSVEAERRRMERDLHDGAQQRLVSLAMTLGRAKKRLGDREPTVRTLIDEAHSEAMQAIAEIRDLTRGLHPPVLTDRGLDAALSAVAARSPVPVRLGVDVRPRPSLTVESIAYFVVTEALTNVAKHSQAANVGVRVVRTGDVLRVEVRDDGRGGADPARGSGLRGLSDRVSGVDGRLTVDSPPGGGTTLIAEVPCD